MSGEKKYHPCDCDTRMVERFETTGVDGMAESLKRMIEANFRKSDIVITEGEHPRNAAELAEACSKRSSAVPAYPSILKWLLRSRKNQMPDRYKS